MNLSPAERNAIRHMRTLLDAYETNASGSYANALDTAAREFVVIAANANADRSRIARESAEATLADLDPAQLAAAEARRRQPRRRRHSL